MSRLVRRWRLVMGLSCAMLLGSAAAAFGSSAVIANGTVNTSGVFGPRHTLSLVDVNWTGGSGAGCVRALNDDGSWATAILCTFQYTSHALCQCQLRYGWNGAGSATASVVGIEYY